MTPLSQFANLDQNAATPDRGQRLPRSEWADIGRFTSETGIPRSTVATWAKRHGWQTIALHGRVYYPRAQLVEQMRTWNRKAA